ncbi:diacylglycerol kinase delta-like [Hyla sarda]|uniref:diacylglycerol kinase delta-like n=1 Tax=Hyla sarda TaxID=327740 RepID=UPI0024C389DD|nr:diacylglycerol kinase delta-like [Hyla sarda]
MVTTEHLHRNCISFTLTINLYIQCSTLNEKLDSLVRTLNEESLALLTPSPRNLHPDSALKENGKELNEKDDVAKMFQSKEQLILRANSLKKALKQIIEQAEKVVDEQNKHTQVFNNPATSPGLKENSEDFNKELEHMGKLSTYFTVYFCVFYVEI